MELIPTRKQWKKWSLPSKLTAIGAYVGIIALVVTIVFEIYNNKPATKKDVEEIINAKIDAFEAKLFEPAQSDIEKEIDREFAGEFQKKKKLAIELYNKGLSAYNRNESDVAIIFLEKAINVFEIPSFFVFLGNSYFQSGQIENAIKDYSKAIDLNQNYAMAFNNRGAAWAEKGDFNRAISDLDKALQMNPKIAEAYYNRGKTFNEMGDVNQAINDLSEAIRLTPNNAEAFDIRGVVWGKKGDFDKAIKDFSIAISIKPQYPRAYYNRGKAFYKKGDYSSAIADYDKAIELKPDYSEAFNNRGLIWGKKGNLNKALEDCSKAIQLNHKNANAHYNLACIYSLLRQPIDACKHLKEAIILNEIFQSKARNNPDFKELESNDCFNKLMQMNNARHRARKVVRKVPRITLREYDTLLTNREEKAEAFRIYANC